MPAEMDIEEAPLFEQAGSSTWAIRYAKGDIAPAGIAPEDLARIKQALRQLPGAMHGELTSLDIKGPLAAVRGARVYRLRVGNWRVIFTSQPDGITVFQVDRRQDDTYSRSQKLAVVRRGSGVAFVEVVPRTVEIESTPEPRTRPTRYAHRTMQQNPLTPFEHSMLRTLGLSDALIDLVRTFPPGIVVADELADRGVDVGNVELVADAWSDPERYLAIFAAGRTPSLDDAQIPEEELATRLSHPDSAESVANLGVDGLDLVLSGDIEEWMFYLHPSQARPVTIPPTGPARIRGGPGTGKTVAALHRARHLVESGAATNVLLTTFVSALPPVWSQLLKRFAPASASSITTCTTDSLARKIVTDSDGRQEILSADGRRAALMFALERVPAAHTALGDAAQFGEEIDQIIVGRQAGTLLEYLDVSRRGRGTRLDRQQREAVWQAYERYIHKIRRDGRQDWSHMRLRALELAQEGAGPRFDAVIVDEAQDLTEVGIRLLLAVDSRPAHEAFLLVGDGQQSIYPGGFSLRSIGLEVRGRSFVLRTNWRNSQAIIQAAELALGQHSVLDLGEDVELSTDEAAAPRRMGEPPRLHLAESCTTGQLLVEVVTDLLERVPAGDIAVLARTNKGAEEAAASLRSNNVPIARLRDYTGLHQDAVRCGTFAYSKGLEFKAVVLVGLDTKSWAVAPYWLKDRDDQREWWANERRTLFVAMTRARDTLDLVAQHRLGRPLEDARAACDEWPW